MSPDPTTQELRIEQRERELREREAERDSELEAETKTHRRRGDKASYLRDKLDERERSEREAGV